MQLRRLRVVHRRPVSRDSRGDESLWPDGDGRGHERDPVLASDVRAARHVDGDDAAARGAQLLLERVAVGAQRVRELHDRLALVTHSAVVAARSASAATMSPRPQPIVLAPSACATVAEPRKATPTMFANRGGRLSSIGPSPKRGWITPK